MLDKQFVMIKVKDSGRVKQAGKCTCELGSAIKNLGLFSKSPGDFRIEKMGFYSSLGRSTPGVLLPRLP